MPIPEAEKAILSQLGDVVLYGVTPDPEWVEAVEAHFWGHLHQDTKDLWSTLMWD